MGEIHELFVLALSLVWFAGRLLKKNKWPLKGPPRWGDFLSLWFSICSQPHATRTFQPVRMCSAFARLQRAHALLEECTPGSTQVFCQNCDRNEISSDRSGFINRQPLGQKGALTKRRTLGLCISRPLTCPMPILNLKGLSRSTEESNFDLFSWDE